MLWELTIENIAVISQAQIRFSKGFNVFTGETGAGKSILLGAIDAVLGGRISRDLIRTGETKATVSALFGDLSVEALAAVSNCGFQMEPDEELLLFREITNEHNICRINGKTATVAMLRDVGHALINTHGQQDNQMLANIENHRKFVDNFGAHGPTILEYQKLYKEFCEAGNALEKVSLDEEERARRIDLLKYQVNEISVGKISEGEEEELLARRKLIKNSETLGRLLTLCKESLDGGENDAGAIPLLDGAAGALAESASYIEELSEPSQKLKEYRYEIEDIVVQVRKYLEELEFDPNELDTIEERLDHINLIKRKYGGTATAALDFLRKAQDELDSMENLEQTQNLLLARFERVKDATKKQAEKLTALRTKSAERFCNAVTTELHSLDMQSVVIQIVITPTMLSKSGADDLEFLLSVNPGETPRPLAKIASGGEMSRIMLAIKSVVSGNDDIATLIFDEIDTGVSGRAAQKVGAKLLSTAKDRQIICVTHLAQVAAFADCHLYIEKQIHDGRTFTVISVLEDDADRAIELARITSGEPITELAVRNAAELLLMSRRKK